jgi:hypothetical protein
VEITPAVNKGGNDVALVYPGDSGPTQSGVDISLGQLVGENHKRNSGMGANPHPLLPDSSLHSLVSLKTYPVSRLPTLAAKPKKG